MSSRVGTLRQLWYQWRMKRFPWRRKWLVGFDLEGNTFWEFKDNLSSNRLRRIAKYRSTTHYGDVNVSPSWMQWLRHTRYDPPSLSEQQSDLVRQERIKMLALKADERWASKPSALDPPTKQQPVQMLTSQDSSSGLNQSNLEQAAHDGVPAVNEAPAAPIQDSSSETPSSVRGTLKPEKKEDPWKKQRPKGNPSDEWQPESWSPAPARRRG